MSVEKSNTKSNTSTFIIHVYREHYNTIITEHIYISINYKPPMSFFWKQSIIISELQVLQHHVLLRPPRPGINRPTEYPRLSAEAGCSQMHWSSALYIPCPVSITTEYRYLSISIEWRGTKITFALSRFIPYYCILPAILVTLDILTSDQAYSTNRLFDIDSLYQV